MIVYRHRTKDTNEVFYIGITNDKCRPSLKKRRNPLWTNIYEKHGRIVDIIATGLTRDQACELEKSLIFLYGRRIDNSGTLANLTNGGDMYNHSEKSKKQMSIIAKNRTKETLLKIKENIVKGGDHYKARKIINPSTGAIYNSIKEASEGEGIKYGILRKILSGERKTNEKNIKYY